MIALLAAAVLQPEQPAAPPPARTPPAVREIEVITRAPIAGDLQRGFLDYRPEFFTAVRPATAMDMVNWLPGFVFEDTRDLRGLAGSTGNVLIDGRPPTSKTDSLSTVLARIPSSQVERIDLIVGGAPGIDMRGRAVIANVILKTSTRPRGAVTLQGRMDRNERVESELSASVSQNKEGGITEGSLQLRRALFAGLEIGEGAWTRRDGTGAVAFSTRSSGVSKGPVAVASGAVERPFAGGRLRVNGSLRSVSFRFTGLDLLTTGPGAYGLTRDDDERRAELGLRYERALGARTSLETQALQRLSDHQSVVDAVRPPTPTTFSEDDDQSESVAQATVRFRRDDTLTLEGSAEGALNTLDTQSARTVNGVPTALPGAQVDVRETRGEAAGAVIWKPGPRYGLTAGLRAETSTLTSRGDVALSRSLSYLKPRAAFSFAPGKQTQVRLRVEREVGQIDFYNFTAVADYNAGAIRLGAPNLKPQRSWVTEAVFERRFWTGGTLVLTARRLALSDVVDVRPLFAPGGVIGAAGNIGDGTQTDLSASLALPLGRLGIRGGMLRGGAYWSRSRVTDPTTGERRRLSNQSPLYADLHFSHDLPDWKLTWGVDATFLAARTLFRPTTTEEIGSATRVNLFVEYRAGPNLTLRAQVDNVTADPQTQRISVYPGLRNESGPSFMDDKRFSAGRYLFLRLRRSFG